MEIEGRLADVNIMSQSANIIANWANDMGPGMTIDRIGRAKNTERAIKCELGVKRNFWN